MKSLCNPCEILMYLHGEGGRAEEVHVHVARPLELIDHLRDQRQGLLKESTPQVRGILMCSSPAGFDLQMSSRDP